MRSCFYLLRDEVLQANKAGAKIPLAAFESELIHCFCLNRIEGFYALSNVIVETPGLEQYASVASRAMTAWLIGIEAIHAAKKP